ncbi:MAG: hypothetical protein ACT4P6_13765 [Gemmatimonadaceae bacterium]
MPTLATPISWRQVGRVDPTSLVDARLQLHHALQIIVAAPISFLEKRADDSHTNLAWLASLEALGTNWLKGAARLRFALRIGDLTLVAVDQNGSLTSEFQIAGRTTADGVAWLRSR